MKEKDRPRVPPQFFSPLNILSVVSFVTTIGLIIWVCLDFLLFLVHLGSRGALPESHVPKNNGLWARPMSSAHKFTLKSYANVSIGCFNQRWHSSRGSWNHQYGFYGSRLCQSLGTCTHEEKFQVQGSCWGCHYQNQRRCFLACYLQRRCC